MIEINIQLIVQPYSKVDMRSAIHIKCVFFKCIVSFELNWITFFACHIAPYCVVSHHTVLHIVILCHTLLYFIVLYSVIT